MILRKYRIRCPLCKEGFVIVRDVPSMASVNKYLPVPDRHPVPPDDKSRLKAHNACAQCGKAERDIETALDERGLPDDAVDVSSVSDEVALSPTFSA